MKVTPKLAMTAGLSSTVIFMVLIVVGFKTHHFLLPSLTGAFFFLLFQILDISSSPGPSRFKVLMELALLSIAMPAYLIYLNNEGFGYNDGFGSVHINSFTLGITIELPFIALSLLAIVLAFRSRKKLERIG